MRKRTFIRVFIGLNLLPGLTNQRTSMECQYRKIMMKVVEVAQRIDLPPEDLAVYLSEGVGLNCPEIYREIREYCGVDPESIGSK